MAETEAEVFRFRAVDLAQFWVKEGEEVDIEKMWSQLEYGSVQHDYKESSSPLRKLSRCKVTLTSKSLTIEDHKGKRIARYDSYLICDTMPPILRMASQVGLCYDNTPEGIAQFESGKD